MPLALENFLKSDLQNSLKECHSREAYRKLSSLLSAAHSALIEMAHEDGGQDNFITWFGEFSQSSRQQVFNNIRAIYTAVITRNITFQNGGGACRSGNNVHVRLESGAAKIYLCDGFFRAGRRGIDSTVGTIIHELSHLIANTHDHASGQMPCRGLAATQSTQARSNADNYQYFCESFS